tara:strand:+ start:96 stop:584 length:489 start_codon:yes stop_codon:yes gene_type:complete
MNILADVDDDDDIENPHAEKVKRQANLKKSRDSLFAFLDDMEIRESAKLEDLESGSDDDDDDNIDNLVNDADDSVDLNSSQVTLVSPNTFRKNTTQTEYDTDLQKNKNNESSTGGTMSNSTKRPNSRDKAIAKLEKIGEVTSNTKGKPKKNSFFACCAGNRD